MENYAFSAIWASQWWRAVEYVALAVLVLLPVKNPLFRVALALHTGLQSVVYALYAVIVHFKSFEAVERDEKRGGIARILNWVPSALSRISGAALRAISVGYQMAARSNLNLALYSHAITFGLISARKLFSLACWGYVTDDDDNSLHLRTLVLFCIFNLIQYRYVVQGHSSFKGSTSKLSLGEGLRMVFVDDSTRSSSFRCAVLKFRRSVFFAAALLSMLFCFSLLYNGFIENNTSHYNASNLIVKFLLAVDVQFSLTMWTELSGLSVNFRNRSHSKV